MSDISYESWEELASVSKRTVDDLISRLPDEFRPEALRIGYQLRKRCSEADGEDVLGDYARSASLITLYLETIHDYCSSEGIHFEHEIERTYLHEFGHHLGLSEKEVRRLRV